SKALPPVGLGVGWSASNSISAGPAHHLSCPPPSRSPSIRRYYIEYRITRESLPPDDLVTLKKSGDFDECRLRTNLWHRGSNLQHDLFFPACADCPEDANRRAGCKFREPANSATFGVRRRMAVRAAFQPRNGNVNWGQPLQRSSQRSLAGLLSVRSRSEAQTSRAFRSSKSRRSVRAGRPQPGVDDPKPPPGY